MRASLSRAAVCLLVAVAAARPAAAQPFSLDEKIKPTELKLQPLSGDPRTAGRQYGATITQTQPDQYFFVQGVSIYSPVFVGVTAEDPSAPVRITLHKENWEQAHATGDTGGSGHWDTKFKTSGDFGIKMTSDRPTARYALLVWVGDEVTAPMPSPFTRGGSPAAAPQSPATNVNVLYLIIALLAGALIAVVLVKSRSARSCLVIGAIAGSMLAAAPVFAQGYDKAVAAMLSDLKQFLSQQESVEKFWQSLKTLSQNEAQPGDTQTGPSLPSSCVDNAWALPANPGCQCMATAVDKLRKNRQMLEKLRVLVANQKNFVDKAIALGNSYAQLHTMLGLQWVGIRKHDIEEPYAQFKQISNQKHQALMAAIQKDLQDISVCEGKLGEKDWYQKFGFAYYEFLYAAYRPAF